MRPSCHASPSSSGVAAMGAIVVAGFPSMKPNRRPISSTTMARCDQSLTKVTSAMCSSADRASMPAGVSRRMTANSPSKSRSPSGPHRVTSSCGARNSCDIPWYISGTGDTIGSMLSERESRAPWLRNADASSHCHVRGSGASAVDSSNATVVTAPLSRSAASASRSSRMPSHSSSAASSVGAMVVARTARVPSRATRCRAPSRVPFDRVASRTETSFWLPTYGRLIAS